MKFIAARPRWTSERFDDQHHRDDHGEEPDHVEQEAKGLALAAQRVEHSERQQEIEQQDEHGEQRAERADRGHQIT